MKMSYYQFNRQEILRKAKKKDTLKKKLLNIIYKIKKLSKKKQENVIKTCHKKKKIGLKSTKKRDIKNWFGIKKKC